MQNDCTKRTEYNVKLMKSWMKGDKALALMTTTIKRFLLLASGSANALMLFAISHNFFASNLFLFRNNYRLLRGKKCNYKLHCLFGVHVHIVSLLWFYGIFDGYLFEMLSSNYSVNKHNCGALCKFEVHMQIRQCLYDLYDTHTQMRWASERMYVCAKSIIGSSYDVMWCDVYSDILICMRNTNEYTRALETNEIWFYYMTCSRWWRRWCWWWWWRWLI